MGNSATKDDDGKKRDEGSSTLAITSSSAHAKGLVLETMGNGVVVGKDKYLGGELGADGNIYAIPGTARTVLRVDTRTGQCTTHGELIGPWVTTSLKRNQFKWLRGIACPDGCIYGLPSNANSVLKITPNEDPEKVEVSIIPGPTDGSMLGRWKWHAGELASNGCITTIPCNADRVLKLTVATGEVTMIGPRLVGQNKWYGGLLSPSDGCIYGIPNCSDTVIRIDPATDKVETFGKVPGGAGGWKWHGGVCHPSGVVVGVPAHAGKVLLIHPAKRVWLHRGEEEQGAGKGGEEGKGEGLGVAAAAAATDAAAAAESVTSSSTAANITATKPMFEDVTEPYLELIGDELGDRRYKYGGAVVDETGGSKACYSFVLSFLFSPPSIFVPNEAKTTAS